jgi:SAM-dependent methyltransferase
LGGQRDIGAYYDRLSCWAAVSRLFGYGYGGGRGRLTVHRALADPRAGGRPTVTRLHDVLFELLPLTEKRVLDAGCGFGGTMLDFAARTDGWFTGLTLSRQQARIGNYAARRANLDDRVRILVQSYDTPAPPMHDVAIAIESLAHSPDPLVSLQAIVGRLAPDGLLAVVDDMPMAAARGTPDLASFQAGWQLPVLWTAEELLAACDDCGLVPIENRDLTDALRPRDERRIAQLEALNRVVRRFAPTEGLRAMLDSYHGGLALERLYRHSLMQYRVVVARKGYAAAARGSAPKAASYGKSQPIRASSARQ